MNTNKAGGAIINLATVLLLLCGGQVIGQEFDSRALADARSALRAEQREIVREELRLTESESKAFWPIYDRFRAELKSVRDRQIELISDYMRAHNAGELTDSLADKLVKGELSIASDLLKVKNKYLRKFGKALPAKKLTRFYQLESQVDAQVDIQLADAIPLFDAF